MTSAMLHAQPPFVAGFEREGTEKFAGAVLVSELGCTACHPSGQNAFAAKPGPDLSTVGARVNGAHLRRFLASPSGCTTLVWGQPLMGRRPDDSPNEKLEPLPVAWVKRWQTSDGKTARVFHSTMGSATDLKSAGLRRLIINAAYWGMGIESSISATRSVDLVDDYQPLGSGFNYETLGVKPRPVSHYR